jgi:hypothetical protein
MKNKSCKQLVLSAPTKGPSSLVLERAKCLPLLTVDHSRARPPSTQQVFLLAVREPRPAVSSFHCRQDRPGPPTRELSQDLGVKTQRIPEGE